MDFVQTLVQTLVGGLVGGSVIGFIEFMIRRKDAKADKKDEILATMKKLSDKVSGIETRLDKENADAARRNILAFDDELRRGIDHSEESFNQILLDVTFYSQYCKDHPRYENNRAVNAIRHINTTYRHVKAENRFI